MAANITASAEWQRLLKLSESRQGRRVAEMLASDSARAERFVASAAGIELDYSRQPLDDEILKALFDLLNASGFDAARDALWRGDDINHTEQRSALHVALRAMPGDGVANDSILHDVAADRARMYALADAIRTGSWCAPNGTRFTDVVHIGIGGSYLGPVLALDLLDEGNADAPRVHFLSNNDPMHLRRLQQQLDPARTLIACVSKSFTTAETKINATAMRQWLAAASDDVTAVSKQFIGISANVSAMTEWGIPAAHQLTFADWVGGRYSLWSAVGFPVALRCGSSTFDALLAGARDMDRHFRNAPVSENLPALLGLIGIWNINFNDAQTHGVLPYVEELGELPQYLQQLEMESNGKQVDRDGNAVNYRTAPVIWGAVGMNGQHAFYQLLHQGTQAVPLDFIGCAEKESEFSTERAFVLANMLAQAEALTQGRSGDQVEGDKRLLPYKLFPGNRPSSTLLLDSGNAKSLGALLAMYEHKVFVQSVIWNLNPFDQFGVELGKLLANDLMGALNGNSIPSGHDATTKRLVERLKQK